MLVIEAQYNITETIPGTKSLGTCSFVVFRPQIQLNREGDVCMRLQMATVHY